MDDGNWLVSHSDHSHTIFFADEIEGHWEYIREDHLRGLTSCETILKDGSAPKEFDKLPTIGIFGGAGWFIDAQSAEVVRVVGA